MSRTGEQFICADRWQPNGHPLLVVMADPSELIEAIIIMIIMLNSVQPRFFTKRSRNSNELQYTPMRKSRFAYVCPSSLTSFQCSVNDTTVPFVTAAIEEKDPFVDADGNGAQM